MRHAQNSYLNLCTQAYNLMRPHPPEEAYAFYRNYVENAGGGAVLEPMCGSGRFLLPFLKENFKVVGFDSSEQMLKALHAKARLEQLKPEVWLGYVEDLNTTKKYNLIFIPSGSFGHIINFDSVRKSLKIFYDHLNENGILVFEVETSKIIPHPLGVWRKFIYHKSDNNFIQVNRLTTYENNICSSIDKYELVEQGQIIQTETERLSVRIYNDPVVLVDTLKQIGFKEINTLKAFTNATASNGEDLSIVFECRK